jgi:hypothetical protein
MSIEKYPSKVRAPWNRGAWISRRLQDEALSIAAYNYKNKSTGKQQKFCLICVLGFGIINIYEKGDRSSWTFHMD